MMNEQIPPGAQVPVLINLLSEQIGQRMRAVSNERHYPARSSDESIDFIKATQKDIKSLRRIREELEVVFYGEIE